MTAKKNKKKAAKPRRSLFAELEQAMGEVKAHGAGQLTLREHTVRPLNLPEVDGAFIAKAREVRGMSRAVFAMKLGLNPRSLEGWEQGKTKPPPTVAALILLAAKFPDIFDRLASLEQIAPTAKNRSRPRHGETPLADGASASVRTQTREELIPSQPVFTESKIVGQFAVSSGPTMTANQSIFPAHPSASELFQ